MKILPAKYHIFLPRRYRIFRPTTPCIFFTRMLFFSPRGAVFSGRTAQGKRCSKASWTVRPAFVLLCRKREKRLIEQAEEGGPSLSGPPTSPALAALESRRAAIGQKAGEQAGRKQADKKSANSRRDITNSRSRAEKIQNTYDL